LGIERTAGWYVQSFVYSHAKQAPNAINLPPLTTFVGIVVVLVARPSLHST